MAVVGKVGAGKSSFVQATLGEMEKLSGTVNVRVGQSISVDICGLPGHKEHIHKNSKLANHALN